MKKTTTICDHCGAEFTDGGLAVNISTGYRQVLELGDIQGRTGHEVEVHVCIKCRGAVLDAMGLSMDGGVVLRRGQYLSGGGEAIFNTEIEG